jgi:hypothetical protein
MMLTMTKAKLILHPTVRSKTLPPAFRQIHVSNKIHNRVMWSRDLVGNLFANFWNFRSLAELLGAWGWARRSQGQQKEAGDRGKYWSDGLEVRLVFVKCCSCCREENIL